MNNATKDRMNESDIKIENLYLKLNESEFKIQDLNQKLKVLEVSELKDLVIKFVRMSDKKNQQKVIEEIKIILRNLDGKGF
ncbi:hypothetical protein KAI04_00510 [Candidatus Pacearchaeota archaeon]|nr:hypothetical protein [Candidatus Pacearchaeota archaeon]